MRRLLEWLDVSHIISGTAHVAVGLFCLTVVGGAFAFSLTNSPDMPVPALVASAQASGAAGSDVVALRIGQNESGVGYTGVMAASNTGDASSVMQTAVFRTSDNNAMLLRDAVATKPVLQIKLNDLERERRCLVQGIYYEARGERAAGQLAVAEVVLNRTLSRHYPSTICGVVFQGAKSGQCQFSFACTNVMSKPHDPVAWRKAQRMAHYVLSGKIRNNIIGQATFYHAAYVNPYWAPHMVEVAKIGQHVFYRSRADKVVSADPES